MNNKTNAMSILQLRMKKFISLTLKIFVKYI